MTVLPSQPRGRAPRPGSRHSVPCPHHTHTQQPLCHLDCVTPLCSEQPSSSRNSDKMTSLHAKHTLVVFTLGVIAVMPYFSWPRVPTGSCPQPHVYCIILEVSRDSRFRGSFSLCMGKNTITRLTALIHSSEELLWSRGQQPLAWGLDPACHTRSSCQCGAWLGRRSLPTNLAQPLPEAPPPRRLVVP